MKVKRSTQDLLASDFAQPLASMWAAQNVAEWNPTVVGAFGYIFGDARKTDDRSQTGFHVPCAHSRRVSMAAICG